MKSATSKVLRRTRPTAPRATILGLDPGVARVGVAVLSGTAQQPRLLTYTTITTPQTQDHGLRLVSIATAIEKIIRRYRPAAVAMEKLFFQTNVKTALTVSEARGVLRLTCAQAGLPCIEFTPNEVKRTVTGSGNADKQSVQKMVGLILGLRTPIASDDAADAAAIALTGALYLRHHYEP